MSLKLGEKLLVCQFSKKPGNLKLYYTLISSFKTIYFREFEIRHKEKFSTFKTNPIYRYINSEMTVFDVRNSDLVTPAGFEPAIAGLRTRSPRPLDEGANVTSECYHIYLDASIVIEKYIRFYPTR